MNRKSTGESGPATPATVGSDAPIAGPFDFAALVSAIRQLHAHCAASASRAVNVHLTLRNWTIGRYIREFEQNGADRASYGASSLEPRLPLERLSFTHLVELIGIGDPLKRGFYEIECIRGNWSVRPLKRQIATLYYERSGMSDDKAKLAAMVQAGAETAEPKLAIRDPYVFEFHASGCCSAPVKTMPWSNAHLSVPVWIRGQPVPGRAGRQKRSECGGRDGAAHTSPLLPQTRAGLHDGT